MHVAMVETVVPRVQPKNGASKPKLVQSAHFAVRESVDKSAASAASPDYVKFQAVIKSAASAASHRGGRLAADLIMACFLQFLAALAAKK